MVEFFVRSVQFLLDEIGHPHLLSPKLFAADHTTLKPIKMVLHAYQDTPFKQGDPTRIVLEDRRTLPRLLHGKKQIANAFQGYSKLRVRIEIHPVSQSNYFHIVVNIYFETSGQGHGQPNDTTDGIELLFLAESRGGSNDNYQSSQRNNAYDSTAQLSSNLSPPALVEISIGGELLVVHVLSEQKSSGQNGSMGENQSFGLCHCVTVRVSKGQKEGLESLVKSSEEATNKKKVSNAARWLGSRTPSLPVVTADDKDQGPRRRHRSDPIGMHEDADDWIDRMIWFPISSTSSPPARPPAMPPTTTVCLQSWSVKCISSQEILMSPADQNVFNGPEGTIVANGAADHRVTRGMEISWI